MKYFTFSFRRLTAVLAVAMSVPAMAQSRFHYEYFLVVPGQQIVPRDQVEQTWNHQYGLHLDEEDSKCINWSANPIDGAIYRVGYLGDTDIPIYILSHTVGYGTFTFVEREQYENGWGPVIAYHILRVIDGDMPSSKPVGGTGGGSVSEAPGKTAVPGGITKTESGMTIILGDEDFAEREAGYILMTKPLTADEVLDMLSGGVGTPAFIDGFRGVFFKLPAGKGYLDVDLSAAGYFSLGVILGTEYLGAFSKDERGIVRIPYDLTDDTWIFLFPTASAPSSIRRAQAADAGLTIYSVSVVPGGSEPIITGDLNGDSKVDIADAVSVLDLMAEGKDDPAADLNGDGKVDIADFVSVLDLMAGQ